MFSSWSFPTGTAVLSTCFLQMPTLRKNKMLSTDCLGTQELHSFCTPTEILKDSHSQETTFHLIAERSALPSNQYACSITELSGDNIGISEVKSLQDESNAATSSLLPLLSCDTRSVVPLSAPCSSDNETIFSPNPKQSDPQLKPINYIGTETDDNTDFLQLILNGSDEGCSASEFYGWDVLDFYFSENISSVHFNSLMGFTNDVGTPHHDCVNIIDMAEKPITLLSLDKTEEADNANDEAPADYTSLTFDDACSYLQTKPSDSDNECGSASWNVIGNECFDQQLLSTGLPDLMDVDSPSCSTQLTQLPVRTKNITLVLDLDETLVHSRLDHCDNADFTLQVFFNMNDHTVYVRERPHLKMFLDKVAQMFDLVIFTASQRIYADQLIDKLDPDGKLISRRFYRESCIFSDGTYTKDLRILGVDMAKVAIIDNTPQVFQLQVDNGIPIKSWFDDPLDRELVEFLPFLETLVDADDVRPIISTNKILQQH